MSTDIQLKGDSLRRQKELSKKYAEQNNLDLVETLQDIGVSAYSGKNSKEGVFGEFLDAVKSNKIEAGSYLLVESLDRLSRESVLTAFNQFTEILQKNITIVTLADNQIYTADSVNKNIGQLFTSLGIMLRANEESKIKSVRLTSVWENKRKSLAVNKYSSICPAWLVIDKKRNIFEENEKLVSAVKKIFEMSLDGNGAYSISCYLNKNLDKFPSNNLNKGWHKSYVQKILNNPAVCGVFNPHKMVEGKRVATDIIVEDYFPVIISKSDFELSQARQKQRGVNGAGRKGDVFSNVFMGLLKCGYCKSNVIFLNKGEPPKGGKYLVCAKSARKLDCTARMWRYEEFESGFFEFIKEADLSGLFNNEESRFKRQELINSITKNKHKVEELNKKIESSSIFISNQSDDLKDHLMIGFRKLIEEKNELEVLLNDCATELYVINNLNEKINVKSNIEAYEESIRNKNDSQVKEIRLKIHNEIKRIISNIIIFSPYNYLPDDDEIDNDEFRKLLYDKGFIAENERIDFILSGEGQRFINRYLRYFLVNFSNGSSRYTNPSQKINFRPKDSKIIDDKIIRII